MNGPPSSSRKLVLFTRSPRAEARAKGLPVKSGARLFERFLESWEEAAGRVGASLLVVAPPTSTRALGLLFRNDPVEVACQRGTSFADRVESAVSGAFGPGTSPLVVAAGDTPAPDPSVLEEAFSRLERDDHQVVLEPSPDGGVNLIGLARPVPGLLSEVDWSEGLVHRSLHSQARLRGLRVHVLPARLDIDRIGDVAEARRLAGGSGEWSRYERLLDALLQTTATVVPLSIRLPSILGRSGAAARAPPILP
ncbi:MAG: DUF2064 domain-containing protein [Candidatus Riflebacteria bacterium]|nr:DUF2064 domain-containing protein [Candidatus Riflebacteria bacterium]